ncbi:DUF4388 domain-containing protein [Deinococcus psychrotolerans]|uniref:DUF4388 domain-containing protein n=1 Tax=Deinococcus psychrotolerans TaxID=2489213 RepID=A0A3G8YQB9_9DEIO|nr:DUF4388 domain-containing protein [Deinococcus psychrotolerans]AZI43396.1 DUF4388 domain-containing protein [Deinococcus psychrotolerans]
MTLWGQLEQYAFIDLVNFVNNQTGTLSLVKAYQGRTLEMYLVKGKLRTLHADGFRIQEQMRVREIIYTLISQYNGKFEFDNRKLRSECDFWLDMDLAQLLTQAAQDTMIPECELPRPHDKFVDACLDKPPTALIQSDTLQDKWQQIQPYLGCGISAAELTGQLFYSERELRVTLHRLLLAGAILPQPKLSERLPVQDQIQVAQGPVALPVKRLNDVKPSFSWSKSWRRFTRSLH